MKNKKHPTITDEWLGEKSPFGKYLKSLEKVDYDIEKNPIGFGLRIFKIGLLNLFIYYPLFIILSLLEIIWKLLYDFWITNIDIEHKDND